MKKNYFDKENIKSTFTGHPLLERYSKKEIDIKNTIKEKKNIFSIYPGSRLSEIKILMPILLNTMQLINEKYKDFFFVFHSTKQYVDLIKSYISKEGYDNCDIVCDEDVKLHILNSSIFAIAKSGTISLEICNAKIPSIIIYKMNIINFLIVKLLVKVKYANIVNIAANKEIIPELLQSNCNPINIFNKFDKLYNSNEALIAQVAESQKIIEEFKTKGSADIASSVLLNHF